MRRLSPPALATALLWLLVACDASADSVPRARAASADPSATSARTEKVPAAGPDDSTRVQAEAEAPPAAADLTEPGRMRFAGSGPEHDFVLAQLTSAEPFGFRAVSASGAVVRMRLAAPFDAAFKPVTDARPLGPLSEIAAYRLARCLGMDSVAPAVTRELTAAQIRQALDPESKQRWPELRARLGVTDDGTVRGAVIYWISELADVGLEREEGLARAKAWLALDGSIPEDRRSLAAALSDMLAFDYVIGNFDRWSGDNVKGDARATRIYVRDHDLAFPARMSKRLHRRLWDDVQRAERFSRRFYAALRGLTRECFEQELAQDPIGPRLSSRQITGVLDRREALLSHVESLIALHGERAVLYFE